MEANKYAFQTTAHLRDDYSNNSHYYTCDGEGSGMNKIDKLGDGSYCPNSQSTIDTNKPFKFKLELEEKDG